MNGEISTDNERKQKGKQRERTKYSIQGKMKGSKGSGWSEEGKVRFNQFFDKVEMDQQNGKEAEEAFKKETIRLSNRREDQDEDDGHFA
eukprot:scaffold65736_cov55-Attheya_sp.AAC.1